MRLAYWPGCVSRGFTTELHGSMAMVAEGLDIELVTLDRANCCGAGVIAEHNQELADTLNARTFALAQETGLAMMNICSTCQGAQSECQERLDANAQYRKHINEALAGEGLEYVAGKDGFTNKNFLWLLVEDIGLETLKSKVTRPLEGLRVGPFYGCYVLRPKDRLGYEEFPERDLYLEKVIEAVGGTVVDYDGARKCCGFPVITMNRDTSLTSIGHARRRRDRSGRGLPGHALPALPPQSRPPAARGGEGGQPRPRSRRSPPSSVDWPGDGVRAEGTGNEPTHRVDRCSGGPPHRSGRVSDESSSNLLPRSSSWCCSGAWTRRRIFTPSRLRSTRRRLAGLSKSSRLPKDFSRAIRHVELAV